jgi:phosphoketolase
MPFISPNTTFGAQGQSVMEASLLIFPEDHLKGQIIESVNYAHENGIDKKEIREWKWPL